MEIAGLPSDHVTIVAVLCVSSSLPGELLGSEHATAKAAMLKAIPQRIVDCAVMSAPPSSRRHYIAPRGPYSLRAACPQGEKRDESAARLPGAAVDVGVLHGDGVPV